MACWSGTISFVEALPQQPVLGFAAPDFAADAYVAGQDRPSRIALGGLRGSWVVLVFYWRDFGATCALELQALASVAPELEREGAVLVAASTDSYLCHRAWLESHPLLDEVRFPVLADSDHRLAAAYGVLAEDGSARRSTFLIDPAGLLVDAVFHDRDERRDPAELLFALRSPQAHSAPAVRPSAVGSWVRERMSSLR